MLILLFFSDPNQFPHTTVPVSNTPPYILGPSRPQRHYVTPSPHNGSDMKNNHMPNMTHGKNIIYNTFYTLLFIYYFRSNSNGTIYTFITKTSCKYIQVS